MTTRPLRTRTLIASAAAAVEPPARVRIWKAGPNPGDYGPLNFTRRAADAIMADFARRGTLGVIDIEHNQNPEANPKLDPNAPPVGGGYYALEVVEASTGPELWFVPRWSDCGAPFAQAGAVCCAKHQITSRQRLYISPDWEMDLETREPMQLNRVSLVGEPATYGVTLLASRAATSKGDRKAMNEEQLRAAYALAKMQAESAEGELKTSAGAYVEQLRAAAKNMGVDLDAEAAPASAEGATASAAGADALPPAQGTATAGAGEREKPMTAARRGAPAKPIALTLTQADVDRMHAEAAAKVELLAANKDRMTPKMAAMLASKSLAEVRDTIEALEPRPAGSEGTGGDVAGAVGIGPMRAPGGKSKRALNPEQNFIASRIRAGLGHTDEECAEMEKKLDDKGGFSISIVELAKAKGRKAA